MALQVASVYVAGGTATGSTLVSIIPPLAGATRVGVWVWTGDALDNNVLQLMFGAVAQTAIPNRNSGFTWGEPGGNLTFGPYTVTVDGIAAVSVQNVLTTVGGLVIVLCTDSISASL